MKITHVPILDKVIKEGNGYHWRSWRVRIKVAMTSYVFSSLPNFLFLAANICSFVVFNFEASLFVLNL